jgi:hypothetical protein
MLRYLNQNTYKGLIRQVYLIGTKANLRDLNEP